MPGDSVRIVPLGGLGEVGKNMMVYEAEGGIVVVDAGLAFPRDEHGLLRAVELREIRPEDGPLDVGPFRLEFVRMAHSVPDNVAVVLEAAGLRVLHTSDYKLDQTPVDGLRTDVGRLAEVGNRGVDLLLGDSTNAERPG